jgi:hypothetical protein
VDALRSALDHAEAILITAELEPEDARALISQPGDSPEIPETLASTINNMRSKKDDYSDDGNSLLPFY